MSSGEYKKPSLNSFSDWYLNFTLFTFSQFPTLPFIFSHAHILSWYLEPDVSHGFTITSFPELGKPHPPSPALATALATFLQSIGVRLDEEFFVNLEATSGGCD